MTIELTMEDRLAASAALSTVPPAANFYTVGIEVVYIAGIRAGMERAAVIVDNEYMFDMSGHDKAIKKASDLIREAAK